MGGSPRGVRIASASLISPLGRSAWRTAAALLRGATTADRVRRLARDLPEGASLDATALARATAAAPVRGAGSPDRAIDLAATAIEQIQAPLAGCPAFIASSKGAVSPLLAPPGDVSAKAAQARCAALGPHGWLASALRDRFSLGATTSVAAACASGLTALDRAVRCVRAGAADRALVVAVEASLHPLFVSAYQRMGALAPVWPVNAHTARPLDRRRRGFTLCECAAAILIESDEALKRDAQSRSGDDSALRLTGRVRATACATEPFDIVRSAPGFIAVERVARRLLEAGRVPADQPIALLQPHATGTPDNDERELAAIARALGRDRASATPVYAHKGAIGHAMGASGLAGAALSLVLAQSKRTPPMPWLKAPIHTTFPLAAAGVPIKPGLHMILSAGFGGHVAGALIEAP